MKKILICVITTLSFFSCIKEDTPVEKPDNQLDNIHKFNLGSIKKDSDSTYKFKNKLIFEDNFDQKSKIPNPKNWTLCSKMSCNWAKYLSENYDQVYVENGNLVILGDKVNGEYKTGGIESKHKFSFKYGKIEVRAKFTKVVKGSWPAIWMMPEDESLGWPDCGEIDIMERLNGKLRVFQTIHSKYKNTLKENLPNPTKKSFIRPFKYNTFGLMWTPEKLVFSVNGRESFTYSNLNLKDESEKMQWPFNKSYYIILNYALGGWAGKIHDRFLPGIMEVDWVKVYQ